MSIYSLINKQTPSPPLNNPSAPSDNIIEDTSSKGTNDHPSDVAKDGTTNNKRSDNPPPQNVQDSNDQRSHVADDTAVEYIVISDDSDSQDAAENRLDNPPFTNPETSDPAQAATSNRKGSRATANARARPARDQRSLSPDLDNTTPATARDRTDHSCKTSVPEKTNFDKLSKEELKERYVSAAIAAVECEAAKWEALEPNANEVNRKLPDFKELNVLLAVRNKFFPELASSRYCDQNDTERFRYCLLPVFTWEKVGGSGRDAKYEMITKICTEKWHADSQKARHTAAGMARVIHERSTFHSYLYFEKGEKEEKN